MKSHREDGALTAASAGTGYLAGDEDETHTCPGPISARQHLMDSEHLMTFLFGIFFFNGKESLMRFWGNAITRPERNLSSLIHFLSQMSLEVRGCSATFRILKPSSLCLEAPACLMRRWCPWRQGSLYPSPFSRSCREKHRWWKSESEVA